MTASQWKRFRDIAVTIAAIAGVVFTAGAAFSSYSPWAIKDEQAKAEDRRVRADSAQVEVLKSLVVTQAHMMDVEENVVLMLVGDAQEQSEARKNLRRLRRVNR